MVFQKAMPWFRRFQARAEMPFGYRFHADIQLGVLAIRA
jgi:hypothetical protein